MRVTDARYPAPAPTNVTDRSSVLIDNETRRRFGLPPLTDEQIREAREEEQRRQEEQQRWQEKRRERRRIIATGKTCSKCGGEIGDEVYRYTPLLDSGYGGTTYRRRPTTDQDPI